MAINPAATFYDCALVLKSIKMLLFNNQMDPPLNAKKYPCRQPGLSAGSL